VLSEAHIEIITLRAIAKNYPDEDIYNINETALFWRYAPNIGLIAMVDAGKGGMKKDKTRITLVYITNATGTDRFSVWVIGKAACPLALRGINLGSMGIV